MPEEEIARFARYEFVHDRNYYHQMAEDFQRYDLEGAFLDSPLPTLILEEKWDLAFMPRKARLFGSQFPNGRLVVFEGRNLATRRSGEAGSAPGVETNFYGEIQPRFSPAGILGDGCICAGALRDVLTAHELNVASGFLAHLHGIGTSWEIPGMDGFKANLYMHDNVALPGVTRQVLIAGSARPTVAGRRLVVSGYADFIGKEGSWNRSLYTEIQLLVDVGDEVFRSDRLYAGLELHGSLNHLGRGSVNQFVPQLMARWVF